MGRISKLAILLCLLTTVPKPAVGGTVKFLGVTNATGPTVGFPVGAAISLVASFTPNPVGSVAVITSATFNIAGFADWNVLTPGSTLTYLNNGAGNDSFNLDINFAPNSGGLGTNFAKLTMNFFDDVNTFSSGGFATDANIGAILTNSLGGVNTSPNGRFNYSGPGGGTVGFNATAQVPEPGSIALLSCLGLFIGRRAWRRQTRKAAAIA